MALLKKEKGMVGLKEAYEIAKMAWFCAPRNIYKKKCDLCHKKWGENGCIAEEKPSLFPVNFEGKCPVCGGELRQFTPF